MSGILKIKRDTTNPANLNDGEFYLNKGINAVQIGSGSSILTLLPLNQIVSGDIILNGNIYANNFGISSSYAETASYAIFAQTTGNVLSASYSNTASIASYILSSNVDGPNGLDSILTASLALTASFAPNYLQLSDTGSMLDPYLPISNTGSMLLPYSLNSQTSSFVTNNQTSSFITNNQTGSFLLVNQTGSMLSSYILNSQTSSFVNNNQTSSFLTNSQTSSFVLNSQTSSMSVATASYVSSSNVYGPNGFNSILSASYAQTASLALGVVGFGNLASSSYPFDVTGSTIYSSNSNVVGNTIYNVATNSNFYVGGQAGANSDYVHSIIIGSGSGFEGINSNYNIFLGRESGYFSENVSHSIFLGDSAGYYTYAHNSVFIGRNSGYESFFSNNSVFIGRSSGFKQENARNSILIGFNAGARPNTGASSLGTNNIILGTNITLPNSTNNSMNFGGIIFASGTYSTLTGNPVATPQSNGRVGINIYPNNYNLEVNGTTNIIDGLYVTNSINLSGSNNHIGNYILTGSILSTGSNTIIGNTTISGSLLTSGSNTFIGTQTISGTLNIQQDLVVLGSASFYYFSTTFVTTSTIVATGSNSLGDTVDDTQTLIGTVNISGSLNVTGSAFLTASNVVGGQNNYISLWNSNNTLTTGSLFETGSNILIGTTTNPNNNFKLHISGNLSVNEFQISSISSSNNLNYIGIFRPSGSDGNTNFLETAQTESQYKWVFRGVNGFGEKREWNQNQSSIFNINLGWNSSAISTFTGSTLLIDPHINVTNGNTVMLRGIYYNPTISSSVNTNHIAIETTTGSIIFKNLPTSSTVQNVILYDTTSGQLFYTASSGVIGGGGSAGTGSNATGSFTTQSVWTFNHNLNNKYVLVQTYDTNWNQIIPEAITLTDANTTTISFPTSESGYAIAMLGGEISLSNYVTNSETSSFVLNSQTSSFVTNTQTASFATTGSNTFRANQIITGSVSITGSVTVTGNIIPGGPYTANTSSYSLGSATAAWKDIYVSNGSVIFLSGSSSSSINLGPAGVLNLTGSLQGTASFAQTSSFVTPLNQVVTIGISSDTASATSQFESLLRVYPSTSTPGIGEGGQIMLAASGALGSTYSSASFIDNYQDQFRILKGSNISGSTGGCFTLNLRDNSAKFEGAVTASGYSGLPNSWLHALRTSSQTIGGGTWADRDIIFDQVASNNFTYNPTTGIATLKANKTYRLTARIAWSAAGLYTLKFRVFNQTTSAFTGPTVEMIQSPSGSFNTSDSTLEHILAVGASDIDISIKTTSDTNALSGEFVRGDLNTQLIIQQIA